MCEDGGLIGYGMAPAVDVVPALQRSHARLPAVVWARSRSHHPRGEPACWRLHGHRDVHG